MRPSSSSAPGARAPLTLTVGLLLAFVALGAVRTLPYLGTYGLDALRDGVVWGYSAFALIVYLLVDRAFAVNSFRLYGWVVPIFALWLPISWNLFATASIGMDPTKPGSFVPLVFFKGGDMAVHTVGAIAFLVLVASAAWSARTFRWRVLIALPLLWTVFVAGTSNRGALVTAVVGIVVIAILARRSATGCRSSRRLRCSWWLDSSKPSSGQPPAPAARNDVGTGSAAEATAAVPLTVANPGFELGPLGDGTIEGWTIRAAGRTTSSRAGASGLSVRLDAERRRRVRGHDHQQQVPVRRWPRHRRVGVGQGDRCRADSRDLRQLVRQLRSAHLEHPRRRPDDDGGQGLAGVAGVQVAPANAVQAELKFFEGSGLATIGIDEVTVRSGDLIPKPIPPKGRPATLQQMIDNLLSIFGSSSDGGLEGSKQFRLAWWGTIIDYTVFGKYFWTGKGFGVNLADADGFQSTADHSLRSPHNTDMTVLARMGVPGLILWLLLQGAFGIGLLRAMLAHRRAGDTQVAVLAALLFAYWVAMLVDTSFDPYLEGPQGGIWFWVIFGLGLVVMRLAPERRATS